MAVSEEAHARFTVEKAAVLGMPACREAMRPALEPPSSERTLPTMVASMMEGSRVGLRASVAERTWVRASGRVAGGVRWGAYSGEELVVVGGFQTTFEGLARRRAHSGEDANVAGVLLQHALEPGVHVPRHRAVSKGARVGCLRQVVQSRSCDVRESDVEYKRSRQTPFQAFQVFQVRSMKCRHGQWVCRASVAAMSGARLYLPNATVPTV